MLKNLAKSKLLWAVLILAPFAISALGYNQFPHGIAQIPIHWNFAGQVDGYGSPESIFILAFIMAATNILMAVFAIKSDQAYDAGLVHGVSKDFAPVVLLGTGVFIVILHAIITAITVNQVLGAL